MCVQRPNSCVSPLRLLFARVRTQFKMTKRVHLLAHMIENCTVNVSAGLPWCRASPHLALPFLLASCESQQALAYNPHAQVQQESKWACPRQPQSDAPRSSLALTGSESIPGQSLWPPAWFAPEGHPVHMGQESQNGFPRGKPENGTWIGVDRGWMAKYKNIDTELQAHRKGTIRLASWACAVCSPTLERSHAWFNALLSPTWNS